MRVVLGLLLALVVGLGIYFYSPDIPHQKLVDEFGGPPTKAISLADGSTAYYRDEGNPDGLPVLLLHGSSSNLFTWAGWIPALAPKYRVITVDLPGHGLTGGAPGHDYSMKGMGDFVGRLTSALQLDHFVIGGNSWGGEIAVNYTLSEPQHVRALIIVDAAGVNAPDAKPDIPLGFKLARMPLVKYGLLWFTPKALVAEGLKKSYGDPSLVTKAQIDRTWKLIRHVGNRAALLQRYSLAPPADLTPRLSAIAVPTLVLWGEADRLVPLADGKVFAANIPGAEAVYFPGVGHVPQEESPEKSAAAVVGFLKRFDAPLIEAPELSGTKTGD
jgi:pimeloyl-ACP methyl ester carboxylesterase